MCSFGRGIFYKGLIETLVKTGNDLFDVGSEFGPARSYDVGRLKRLAGL